MESEYDVVGIGLGPFNLGLAALLDGLDREIDARFFDLKPEFQWHEDMILDGTQLQIPFIGDLVTVADPTNPHSFLNYLRHRDRIWEFYNYETFNLSRKEYNLYGKWVADRIDFCSFDSEVVRVAQSDGTYVLTVRDTGTEDETTVRTDDVVLGVGTKPHVPDSFEPELSDHVFHSSEYRSKRSECLSADSITIVGSGQSSAEIFLDLLRRQESYDFELDWITRSEGFYPVDPSKLTKELRTPNYMDYFYDLPEEVRRDRLGEQDLLYKGISPGTSAKIFDHLYNRSIDAELSVRLLAKTDVTDIESTNAREDTYRLDCYHWEEDRSFIHETDVVVLATGLSRPEPAFLDPISDQLRRDGNGTPLVTKDFRLELEGASGDVYVQNRSLHCHGFNSPDLSIGAYRNGKIVNSILGEAVYDVGGGDRFQTFKTEAFVEASARNTFGRPESIDNIN